MTLRSPAAAAASVAVLLCLLAADVDAASNGCSLRLKDLAERPPLLLRPNGPLNVSGFAAPDADKVLRLAANATILLACPGAANQLLFNNRSTGLRQINATCVFGVTLLVRGGAWVDARHVSCAAHAERVAELDDGRRCGARGRGLRMRVGFRLQRGFLEIVGSCFDAELLTPIYSNYTLVHAIAGKRSGGDRAIFRTGGVFGTVSPRHQYDAQNATLQGLLGVSENYTCNDTLTRGHLASRAGFVFWPQKRATFFYVNAAPQWRSINAGAWAAVERTVRTLAAARGDLLVVTGVFGVAQLNDFLDRPTSLFLYVNGSAMKMPVPALYWKVVYDKRSREGAAIIGSNNPFASLATHPEVHLCPDVCDLLKWLPLTPANRTALYCCEVNALRLRVDDMPPLDVRGLLKALQPSRVSRTARNEGVETSTSSGWMAILAADAAFSSAKITENSDAQQVKADLEPAYHLHPLNETAAREEEERRVQTVARRGESAAEASINKLGAITVQSIPESMTKVTVETEAPVLNGWKAILEADAMFSTAKDYSLPTPQGVFQRNTRSRYRLKRLVSTRD